MAWSFPSWYPQKISGMPILYSLWLYLIIGLLLIVLLTLLLLGCIRKKKGNKWRVLRRMERMEFDAENIDIIDSPELTYTPKFFEPSESDATSGANEVDGVLDRDKCSKTALPAFVQYENCRQENETDLHVIRQADKETVQKFTSYSSDKVNTFDCTGAFLRISTSEEHLINENIGKKITNPLESKYSSDTELYFKPFVTRIMD